MRKFLIATSLIFIYLVALGETEVPQKTKQEIIGQLNPFSSEIYVYLDKLDEEIKIFNEKKEKLKFKMEDKFLKISYEDINKPKKLVIQKGDEEFAIKEVYPNSEISEKAYRDKNFNIFEIKNSYLYNAHKIDEGEYTTIFPTQEVSLEFGAISQPYKAITSIENPIKGNVIITVYDYYNGNKLEEESQDIVLYEGKEKIDVSQKNIYSKKFKEPVKIKIKWKFELGAYKTYIYDKEYMISFIKNINLLLKYKDLDNEYYESIE